MATLLTPGTPIGAIAATNVLESAGLVASEKRGQFVFYRLAPESLANTLHGFVQEVCSVARPLKRESAAIDRGPDDRRPVATEAGTEEGPT